MDLLVRHVAQREVRLNAALTTYQGLQMSWQAMAQGIEDQGWQIPCLSLLFKNCSTIWWSSKRLEDESNLNHNEKNCPSITRNHNKQHTELLQQKVKANQIGL